MNYNKAEQTNFVLFSSIISDEFYALVFLVPDCRVDRCNDQRS